MLIFLQHPLFIAVQSCIVKQITACHDDLPTVQSQSGLLTSIKDVCYSNIGPQGSHLPAPLQQPYVSVHHAHALRQTVGSDILHGRHNLYFLLFPQVPVQMIDCTAMINSFIGKLLYVLLFCHCLAIKLGQQQVRGAIMPPVCQASEQ